MSSLHRGYFSLYFLLLQLLCMNCLLAATPKQQVPLDQSAVFLENKACMLAEIDALYHTFKLRYAPIAWKQAHLGWDLATAIKALQDQVQEHPSLSTKDFQRLLSTFFNSAHDFHTHISFHSTEFSLLPFRMALTQERCFVTAVNKDAANYDSIPVEVGDEILVLDGLPAAAAVRAFAKRENQSCEDASEYDLAANLFTVRFRALGYDVPLDKLSIEVKPRGAKRTKLYRAAWDHHPEKITYHWQGALTDEKQLGSKTAGAGKLLGEHPFFQKTMSLSLYEAIVPITRHHPELMRASTPSGHNHLLPADGFQLLGNSATPAFAAIHSHEGVEMVAQLDSPFHEAFIYQTPQKHHIGYIRLPDYYGSHEEAEDFAGLIEQFQYRTDALIIDQVNNPGGHFFYMYALASLLTPKPLKTHVHQQALTHADVAFALQNLAMLEEVKDDQEEAIKKVGLSIQGFHVDLDAIQAFCDNFKFIIEEWEEGRWLTRPNPLMGITTIKPHPKVHYSRPIIMLINGLAFSCGDFMPALLQDNKRATLLGTRTPGAGGYVARVRHPNRFGINDYTYTASFALRADGVTPIENLGVTPDIEYVLTPADYQNNFAGYYKAIDAAVEAAIVQEQRGISRVPSGRRKRQPLLSE